MFVYIFCIMWATFFAFLAEKQFKKDPNKSTAKSRKHKYSKVPVDQKDDINNKDNEIVLQPLDENAENNNINKNEKDNYDEVVFDGNDETATIIPTEAINASENIDISDSKISKTRSIIVENNLPLNKGPASNKYKEIKISTIDINDNIVPAEDNNKVENETKAETKNSKINHIDKAPRRNQHAVGNEIFRSKSSRGKIERGKKVIDVSKNLKKVNKDDGNH